MTAGNHEHQDGEQSVLHGSLYGRDYLRRTLGKIAREPYSALTELVANAWDAGASIVDLTIPEDEGYPIVVADDGTGMTRDQFLRRWMTLGYSRREDQGTNAEFPPGRAGRRPAYGRNGLGRHAMLCFADEYIVTSSREGQGWRFTIRAMSGREPYALVGEERVQPHRDHGTTVQATAAQNLVSADRVREVLGARFFHDPTFRIAVNGELVELMDLSAIIEETEFTVDGAHLRIVCVDSSRTARRMAYHGVAFWVGGRLVGEQSWQVGRETLLDGRTSMAKRVTLLVQCDGIIDQVVPDWSGFLPSPQIIRIEEKVVEYARDFLGRIHADRVEEKKRTALRNNRGAISKLDRLGKVEVDEFLDDFTHRLPTASEDTITVATESVVNLIQTQSGRALLEKLSHLAESDIEALNDLLNEWSIRDALLVLREIDRRMSVVEALKRLTEEPLRSEADELHTIHPLVTQARWLFGPQFDSTEYTFNLSVRRALEELFKKKIDQDQFVNYRRRPDLLVLGDSTLSAVATERFDGDQQLSVVDQILIVEVKRANGQIGRDEMTQAYNYVEDLLASGVVEGSPRIDAFVVGDRVDSRIQTVRLVGDPQRGKVTGCNFRQLVSSADKRLFRLRGIVERYEPVDSRDLVAQVLGEGEQNDLFDALDDRDAA